MAKVVLPEHEKGNVFGDALVRMRFLTATVSSTRLLRRMKRARRSRVSWLETQLS
jgi:hypothetical protein